MKSTECSLHTTLQQVWYTVREANALNELSRSCSSSRILFFQCLPNETHIYVCKYHHVYLRLVQLHIQRKREGWSINYLYPEGNYEIYINVYSTCLTILVFCRAVSTVFSLVFLWSYAWKASWFFPSCLLSDVHEYIPIVLEVKFKITFWFWKKIHHCYSHHCLLGGAINKGNRWLETDVRRATEESPFSNRSYICIRVENYLN
jgi:hypothetical protein